MSFVSCSAAVDSLFAIPTLHAPTFPPSTPPLASAATSPEPRRPGLTPVAPAADLFACFAAELRQEMAPTSLLEHVLTERIVLAAWRLDVISREETREAHSAIEPLRPIGREALRAEGSLDAAMLMLERARHLARAVGTNWQHAAATDSKAGYDATLDPSDDVLLPGDADDDLSNEWPILPVLDDEPIDGDDEYEAIALDREADLDAPADDDDDDADDSTDPYGPLWAGRLVFDANVSATSPVVKGTWVTASRVVSRIVDGWTWSDVLRAHPELTEDDVRACLAYTVALDDGSI